MNYIGSKYKLLPFIRRVIFDVVGNNLSDKVELAGTFCLGKCQQGVCVMVDEEFHSVSPETAVEFFKNEILAKA